MVLWAKGVLLARINAKPLSRKTCHSLGGDSPTTGLWLKSVKKVRQHLQTMKPLLRTSEADFHKHGFQADGVKRDLLKKKSLK